VLGAVATEGEGGGPVGAMEAPGAFVTFLKRLWLFVTVILVFSASWLLVLLAFSVFGFLFFWLLWFLGSMLQLSCRQRVKYQYEIIERIKGQI
jgi:hypothetical protein